MSLILHTPLLPRALAELRLPTFADSQTHVYMYLTCLTTNIHSCIEEPGTLLRVRASACL